MDQLIVGSLQKRRVNGDHRLETLAGEPGRECDGVLFRNRNVEITVREPLGVLDQSGSLAHRRRYADDLRVAFGHVAEPLTEDLRVARAGTRFLEDLAAHGIEGARAMPLDGILFGGRVAL